MSNYGYTKKVEYTFEQAVEKAREELQKEGFGILTEIDVQATMKKKLDKDIEPYLILGACNPPLAAKALEAETELGLLLPCNVIVYCRNKEIYVSAMKPSVAMGFINNPALAEVAKEVESKLQATIDRI